jgi:hypothetical protein
MKINDRKKIPSDCLSCGKTFKNVYAMSSHKNHCQNPDSTKHLDGKRSWNKGKILASQKEIFCENSKYSTGYAKKALLAFKIKHWKCECCDLEKWCGKEITLELDHINGDNRDHRVQNLRLLCPNCHSQTDTWRGRNKNKGKQKVSDQDLLIALENQKNIRQALLTVGLSPKAENYKRCKKILSVKLQKES